MSLIVPIDHNPTFTPKHSLPAPERLISGSPEFLTWAMDESRGGQVKTGVWQARRHPADALDQGRDPRVLPHHRRSRGDHVGAGRDLDLSRRGDSFVMKPGFVGTWKTIETVKKVYLVVY